MLLRDSVYSFNVLMSKDKQQFSIGKFKIAIVKEENVIFVSFPQLFSYIFVADYDQRKGSSMKI